MLPSFLQTLCKRDLSKYSTLTPRIRLLMLLPSPWHKMIFHVIVASCVPSDLHNLPKVRECYIMRNFGTYFSGTYMFLLVLCESSYCTKVQYFVKYQNTHVRDPMRLLSMDILVGRFLEIGSSDLLVSTQRLQDPLYSEV